MQVATWRAAAARLGRRDLLKLRERPKAWRYRGRVETPVQQVG